MQGTPYSHSLREEVYFFFSRGKSDLLAGILRSYTRSNKPSLHDLLILDLVLKAKAT